MRQRGSSKARCARTGRRWGAAACLLLPLACNDGDDGGTGGAAGSSAAAGAVPSTKLGAVPIDILDSDFKPGTYETVLDIPEGIPPEWQLFRSPLGPSGYMAADESSIYWVGNSGVIYRANRDGTGEVAEFAYSNHTSGLLVHGGYLYRAGDTDGIVRIPLDDGTAKQRLDTPWGSYDGSSMMERAGVLYASASGCGGLSRIRLDTLGVQSYGNQVEYHWRGGRSYLALDGETLYCATAQFVFRLADWDTGQFELLYDRAHFITALVNYKDHVYFLDRRWVSDHQFLMRLNKKTLNTRGFQTALQAKEGGGANRRDLLQAPGYPGRYYFGNLTGFVDLDRMTYSLFARSIAMGAKIYGDTWYWTSSALDGHKTGLRGDVRATPLDAPVLISWPYVEVDVADIE